MTDAVDEFLAHFGVKGMKWGVSRHYDSRPRSNSMKHVSVASLRTRGTAHKEVLQVQSEGTPRKDGFSRGQKIALGVVIGVGVAALGVGAFYGARKFKEIRKIRSFANLSKDEKIQKYMDGAFSAAGQRQVKQLKQKEFDLLPDVDTTIAPGTVFKRLTTDPNEDMSRRLYATYKDADHDRYQAVFADVLRRNGEKKEILLSEMPMKSAIKIPSEKKSVQSFIDLLEQNPEVKDSVGSPLSARDFTIRRYIDVGFKPGTPMSISNKDLALAAYRDFDGGHLTPNVLHDKYYDLLRSNGYNALVDTANAGTLSENPVILIDAANTVSERVVKPLTPEMEQKALDRLIDFH